MKTFIKHKVSKYNRGNVKTISILFFLENKTIYYREDKEAYVIDFNLDREYGGVGIKIIVSYSPYKKVSIKGIIDRLKHYKSDNDRDFPWLTFLVINNILNEPEFKVFEDCHKTKTERINIETKQLKQLYDFLKEQFKCMKKDDSRRFMIFYFMEQLKNKIPKD